MSGRSHRPEAKDSLAPPSSYSKPQQKVGNSSPALFGGLPSEPALSFAPIGTFNLGASGASPLACQKADSLSWTAPGHGSSSMLPNNGTKYSVLTREPFTGRDNDGLQVYQTCTFQSPYSTYSLEELRLKDYRQGQRFGTSMPQNLKVSENVAGMTSESHPVPVNITHTRLNLQWLLGDVLELQIRNSSNCPSGCCKGDSQAWHLPKALLLQHSKYLADVMEACTGSKNMLEVEDGRLSLPQEYPCAFTRFVEWLYYGSYTQPSFWPESINIDITTYQLGEKLQAVGFQNYAMGCIYKRRDALAPMFVDQAFRNISKCSPLRKFYLDFLSAHFTESNRVTGSITEWDRIMQDFPDIRVRVLHGIRANDRPKVKSMAAYMLPSTHTTSSIPAPTVGQGTSS